MHFENDIDKLSCLTKLEVDLLKRNEPNPDVYSLLSFQEALRNCLLEYLNTPFLLSYKTSKSFKFLKKFYSYFKIKEKTPGTSQKIKNLPSLICHGYKALDELLKNNIIDTYEKNLNIELIETSLYSQLTPIEKYIFFTKKNLDEYLYASVVHGSGADLELTPFSDLDTFLLIKKETIFSEKALNNFKKQWQKSLKYLYKFDCLQHHDHMVATEVDLNLFPYHWLPPQILEDSKLVTGRGNLKPKIYKSSFNNIKVFFSLTQRFRDSNIESKKYNEYSLKNDISILSLLPALYLQSIGIDTTKKESFSNEKLLSIDKDGFFKEISTIRQEWEVKNLSKFIISWRYNYYVRKFYLKYLIPPVGTTKITNNSFLKKEFLVSLNNIINKMSTNIIDAFN